MLKIELFPLCAVALALQCIIRGEAAPAEGSTETEIPLPDVPVSLEQFHYASRLVAIWENRIFQINQTRNATRKDDSQQTKLKLILAPTEVLMMNLLPQDAPQPLYSKKYANLADNFILDSISPDTLNHEDNRLETPEGLSIRTISGKCLLFKRNFRTQILTVNGVAVKSIHKTNGVDPVTVIDLDGFLFNYRKDISEAYNDLTKEVPQNKSQNLAAAEVGTSKMPTTILTTVPSTTTTLATTAATVSSSTEPKSSANVSTTAPPKANESSISSNVSTTISSSTTESSSDKQKTSSNMTTSSEPTATGSSSTTGSSTSSKETTTSMPASTGNSTTSIPTTTGAPNTTSATSTKKNYRLWTSERRRTVPVTCNQGLLLQSQNCINRRLILKIVFIICIFMQLRNILFL